MKKKDDIDILKKKSKNDSNDIKDLKKKNRENFLEIRKLRKKLSHVPVKQGKFFLTEFKKQTLTLLLSAFGFLAALTWRDAIGAWLAPILKDREGVFEFTLVAIIVTIIAVIVPVILTRFFGSEEKK